MGEKNGGKGKALAPEGKTSVRGELLEVGDILLDQLQQLAAVDHFLHSLDVGPDLTVDLEEGDLLADLVVDGLVQGVMPWPWLFRRRRMSMAWQEVISSRARQSRVFFTIMPALRPAVVPMDTISLSLIHI